MAVKKKYSPITEDDEWFAGEQKAFQFEVVDEEGGPQNISSWTFEWVMRQHPREQDTMLVKSTGSGVAVIGDGTAGIVEVTIQDDDTTDMRTGKWFHTLKRADDGQEAVVAYGEAVLRQAATR